MRQRVLICSAVCLWLLGWGYFGLPQGQLTATPRLHQIEWVPELHKPPDMLFNFAYYVLFGLLASTLGTKPLPAVTLAMVLSATTELSQLFSVSRHPSATDFVINTAGALVGVYLIVRRNAGT